MTLANISHRTWSSDVRVCLHIGGLEYPITKRSKQMSQSTIGRQSYLANANPGARARMASRMSWTRIVTEMHRGTVVEPRIVACCTRGDPKSKR